MSETKPQDTASEKPQITAPVKEKNPNRVAAGKKLAAYSKAAKERLKHQAQQSRDDTAEQPDECKNGVDTMTILTGVGVLTGLVCLYYTYRQNARSEKAITTPHPQPHVIETRQEPATKSRLRSFD